MKITLIKTEYKNGDISIETDLDHIPYQKYIKEWTQEIEIDESKWEETIK